MSVSEPLQSTASPAATVPSRRRLVKLLVVLDLIAVAAVLGVLALRGDEIGTGDGLRGSVPPADQHWPDLARINGIMAPVPTRREVAGRPAMLVVTCLRCRSGDILGGFLARIAPGVSDDASIVVAGWGGDAAEWRRRWRLPRSVGIHVAAPGAAPAELRRVTGVGDSGSVFLHDPQGRWRTTHHLGQLDAEDVDRDLAVLARR